MSEQTNVKEFLQERISDLRRQLSAITDAEDKAATNLLVGKCYRKERTIREKDGTERVVLDSFMKIVDAHNGDVTIVTLRISASKTLPDIEVVVVGYRSVPNLTVDCVEMTSDEWNYHFRSRVLGLAAAVTGEALRFEVVEIKS